MLDATEVNYARSNDGASIAYQAFGSGPVNLVWVGGPAAHLDLEWENPTAVGAFEQLASFARVIRLDRRGTGLSDPLERPPTLDLQMDDLNAVLDAVGLEQAALFGGTDAGLGALFAATFPERVSQLVLWGVAARMADAVTPHVARVFAAAIESYGQGKLLEIYAPSRVGDSQFEEWWRRYERSAAPPAMARKLFEMVVQTDISAILPTINVPTLVLHRTGDVMVPVKFGRELAAAIPGAEFLELPGTDAYGWASDPEPTLDALEEFLTGTRSRRDSERVLATVLFTDVVGSTEHAAKLGDRGWRDLLERHDALVRAQISRARGREIKSTGDGFLATFDGPARAVECASAVVNSVRAMGIDIRAGLHTGEIELIGDGDVGGIAVHIGARVSALADPGEVLVSSTVRDLVVGSGLEFAERGSHALKGVPGEWELFSLAAA